MLKLLVADMSAEFTDAVAQALESEFEMRFCHDGETALKLLREFKPDALILNLILPFKDGLTVLQESDHKPRVIMAVTNILPPYAEKRAAELGVQYALIMPTVKTVRLRLLDLIAEAEEGNGLRVAAHLRRLGFRTHLDGYRQLCVGIPIFAQNPGMQLSKELYPAVSREFGLPDPRTVEHSVRKAINDAWARRDIAEWERYFPDARSAPTNKAFISRLAEISEL